MINLADPEKYMASRWDVKKKGLRFQLARAKKTFREVESRPVRRQFDWTRTSAPAGANLPYTIAWK